MNKRRFRININGKEFVVDVEELSEAEELPAVAEKTNRFEPTIIPEIRQNDNIHSVQLSPPSKEQGIMTAPMPGVVVSIIKKVGDNVDLGEPILILEAMKMENEIRASVGGVILEIKVSPGQRVDIGETLVVIE